MTRRFIGLALAAIVPAFLLAAPASAQDRANGGGGGGAASHGGGGGNSGGGGSAGTASAGGGGGSATASGGGSSSGGGGGWSGGGIRSESGGGGRVSATGGSGIAVSRGGDRGGDRDDRGGRASGGGSTEIANTGNNNTATGTGSATARTDATGGRSPRTIDGGTPQYSRPRDGREAIGTAVPRGSVPTTDRGGRAIFVPAGYYGGLFGYGYYDPYNYYGGYYGGYYDPWYGAYPSYDQSTYTSGDEGSLRLKIKPREAEVYVDGYYVGIVDDFDGIFQRLHIETGAHRIEVRAPGYEPLTFEVRISSEHTTTYQGELKRIQ